VKELLANTPYVMSFSAMRMPLTQAMDTRPSLNAMSPRALVNVPDPLVGLVAIPHRHSARH
jgi:hypothetical protein